MNPQKPPAIYLMGPTAAGKSGLAVQIAQSINAEIISVDSALVYRGMDIGTAKPNLAERGGITHHLIDILDASESYSTGQFKAHALSIMEGISQRGKIPLLVGGTMLYFNALLHGLATLPPADPSIRQQLDEELQRFGKEAMHQRLQQIDPVAASRIHPHDPQRIQRALEVYAISGKPISSYFTQTKPDIPYHPIKIFIAPTERKQLHRSIQERFLLMLKQGLVEEVEVLFRRGDLDKSMPSIRAVGYRQVWSYLHNEYDYATMTEKAIVATRQLAKRQFTWLRKEREDLRLDSNDTERCKKAIDFIADFV